MESLLKKKYSQIIKWSLRRMGTTKMRKLILKECRAPRTTSFYMTTRKLTGLAVPNAEPLGSQQRTKINMLEQRWVEKL